jgi:large subunit ribosomal protein L6
MSRIGKKIISVPEGVTVLVKDDVVLVKGPKGELSQRLVKNVMVSSISGGFQVSVKKPEDPSERALWGLYQRLIENMIEGVVRGYEKKLQLVGVGFKAQVQGNTLVMSLGFSHPVKILLPAGINASVAENEITVGGIDKQLVGEVAAQIRAIRKPEPYKGKGIRYFGESIRRKAGKSAKTA